MQAASWKLLTASLRAINSFSIEGFVVKSKNFCLGRSSLDRRSVLDWPLVQRTHFEWNRKGGTVVKRQGGQDIVEFALMIPLFFLCITAIAAFGFYFGDWVTYNNLARDMARRAAVAEFTQDSKSQDKNVYSRSPDFNTIRNDCLDNYEKISSNMYTLKQTKENQNPIMISVVDKDGNEISDGKYDPSYKPFSVKVKLTAGIDTSRYLGRVTRIAIPKDITVTYFMYDENNPGNK